MNCDADSGVSVPAGRGRGRGRGGGIAVLPEVSRGLSLRYNRGIRNMKEKEKEEYEGEGEGGSGAGEWGGKILPSIWFYIGNKMSYFIIFQIMCDDFTVFLNIL